MKVAIGSDHRGLALKNDIITMSYEVEGVVEWVDLGPQKFVPDDDYPDITQTVVQHLLDNSEVEKAILLCGSGVGTSMLANKFPGIRCGLGFNPDQVIAARKDDDINLLALGAEYLSPLQARNIVEAFLQTEYSNLPAYQRRLDKVREIEKELHHG